MVLIPFILISSLANSWCSADIICLLMLLCCTVCVLMRTNCCRRHIRIHSKTLRKHVPTSTGQLTDQATTENHIIDWEGVNIVDKEPNLRVRHIKEAIWIRKPRTPINREESNYELPHVYDDVIQRHRY